MKNESLSKIILFLFLLGVIVVGAIPGYFSGYWRWQKPPAVANIEQLRHLRTTGLTVENWQTLDKQPLNIGGLHWILQDIQNDTKTKALILLLPQSESTDQPQVEWTDISGLQRWNMDSQTQIKFTATTPQNPPSNTSQTATVEANFFRAWSDRQTWAVVSWYAFPTGGNPSPQAWFWADRKAQLSNRRVPWVAVSIQIFIEPLGDISKIRPVAESLAKNVQTALMTGPLAE
ncbi:cyanoexosortase B system-associated protein [Ancylothrix sp. C2]|uniref:cyanoexosortase B system-associated protein n=1 Tax=Ancylothrix sp. D3o TaxID=2953691 RepID=UPI0021BAEF84|nr:cyanoexosortase B system-associated protein [Ancylothrix sp. D3o]MCT7950680.1 cyanoexosortase B system-associated protein [Ancylothrix sp. D3o]